MVENTRTKSYARESFAKLKSPVHALTTSRPVFDVKRHGTKLTALAKFAVRVTQDWRRSGKRPGQFLRVFTMQSNSMHFEEAAFSSVRSWWRRGSCSRNWRNLDKRGKIVERVERVTPVLYSKFGNFERMRCCCKRYRRRALCFFIAISDKQRRMLIIVCDRRKYL